MFRERLKTWFTYFICLQFHKILEIIHGIHTNTKEWTLNLNRFLFSLHEIKYRKIILNTYLSVCFFTWFYIRKKVFIRYFLLWNSISLKWNIYFQSFLLFENIATTTIIQLFFFFLLSANKYV